MGAPDDIVLGVTLPPGRSSRPVALSQSEQRYHGLIWGATGVGKSYLLAAIFLQHLNKGHAVCLTDPHADLALECLGYLVGAGYFQDEAAYERLVYIDFPETSHVPFNVLAQRYSPHTTAQNTLEALVRTWKELQNAPLFKTLFLSGALTLSANQLPLTRLYDLLLDTDFREACLTAVDDPLVHQTFAYYGQATKGQAASTLRRAFLLSFSPVARGCLGQRENRLDLRALMDEGKSLIINLGSIADPATRRLMGCLIMVQIEQAALSRTDVPPRDRRAFTCLVDEWPSFAATQPETIQNVLEQARKYNLRLYLAAQSLAQVDSRRLAGALENCGLSITFRLGRDSAEIQARHIGEVDPRRTKTSATGRPQFVSASEQERQFAHALATLPAQEAFVKLANRSVVRMKTLGVNPPPRAEGDLEAVIDTYRRRYQRPARDVRAEEASTAEVPPRSATSSRTPVRESDILSSSLYETFDPYTSDLAALFGEAVNGQVHDGDDA